MNELKEWYKLLYFGWQLAVTPLLSPRNDRSEERAKKFDTDDASGLCFWLVEVVVRPVGRTTQIWVVTLISMLFLAFFLRRRFAGKPVVVSPCVRVARAWGNAAGLHPLWLWLRSPAIDLSGVWRIACESRQPQLEPELLCSLPGRRQTG